jgi:hypothetical protein
MRAQGFDTTGGDCLNQLTITIQDAGGNTMFNANVSMLYSFRGAKPAGGTCNTITPLAVNTGKESTVLVDVTVTDNNLSTEPVRVHERSWQKF